MPSDNKEFIFGSSNQEALPSTGKNTGIVLVPCHSWECVPTAISGGLDISQVPRCHLLQQMIFSSITNLKLHNIFVTPKMVKRS